MFIALLGGAAPSDTMPTVSPLMIVPTFGGLMAAGFFYVALAGHRLAKSRQRSCIAGLLLAVPLTSGIWLLATPEEQMLHTTGFFLAAPACFLLLCAIWPLRLTSVSSRPDDDLQ
jgi:hypothetical protein